MTFKELCIFARKHGLSISIEPDPMGNNYPPSIRLRALKDNAQYATILTFEDLDNDAFADYMLEHLRCSIEAALPKTYLEEFKRYNPHILEFSRLIYERCPGNYFKDGPVERPACQRILDPECIGCTACWNQKCTGKYIQGRKSSFPDDSEEVYK